MDGPDNDSAWTARSASKLMMDRFEEQIRTLPDCSRCERDADEKCEDRHLAFSETFTLDDLTCGCACWTRTPVENGSMSFPFQRLDPIPRDDPDARQAWLSELAEAVRMDAMQERKHLRARGVLAIGGIPFEDLVDPVLQQLKTIPPEKKELVRVSMDNSEETVLTFMESYRNWLVSWMTDALDAETLDDQFTQEMPPRSEPI